MVQTIEQTLEGKEKGGKQFASIRKSIKRTGKLRQSLRKKADHYFMGHPDRGLHLLFAQEKFDESSGKCSSLCRSIVKGRCHKKRT
jgi:hypothetical protein